MIECVLLGDVATRRSDDEAKFDYIWVFQTRMRKEKVKKKDLHDGPRRREGFGALFLGFVTVNRMMWA